MVTGIFDKKVIRESGWSLSIVFEMDKEHNLITEGYLKERLIFKSKLNRDVINVIGLNQAMDQSVSRLRHMLKLIIRVIEADNIKF